MSQTPIYRPPPTPSGWGGLRDDLGAMIGFAWPIVIAQAGKPLMGLVTIAFVGRVSTAALAGTGIGGAISVLLANLFLGIAMALEPLASQAVGEGEPARAWSALRATWRVLLLLWLPLLACGLALTLVLEPVGVSHEVARGAFDYVLGQAPGLLLFGCGYAARVLLQAHGESRPALVAVLIANVTNIVASPLLVQGDEALRALGLPDLGLPTLGPFGAGLAASVSEFVIFAILLRAASAHRPAASAHPVPAGRVFSIGWPISLQLAAGTAIFTVVTVLAGRLGDDMASAHQVALALVGVTLTGARGIAAATAVGVGRAVGSAVSPLRAGSLGIGLVGVLMTLLALGFAAAPRALMAWFTNDAELIEIGAPLLRIAACFQLFAGLQEGAAGALRGAGDVRYTLGVSVVAFAILGLPLAVVFGFGFGWGVQGLWWGLTVGVVLAAVALVLRFVRISLAGIARVG